MFLKVLSASYIVYALVACGGGVLEYKMTA